MHIESDATWTTSLQEFDIQIFIVNHYNDEKKDIKMSIYSIHFVSISVIEYWYENGPEGCKNSVTADTSIENVLFFNITIYIKSIDISSCNSISSYKVLSAIPNIPTCIAYVDK